jgi:Bacterial dnaA protein helix-turn-helix
MIDLELATPATYAAHLASYIGDPSTIRARTLGAYGHAPSLDECRRFRERHLPKPKLVAGKPLSFRCKHPRTEENTILTLAGNDHCRTCDEARKLAAAAARQARIEHAERVAQAALREKRLREQQRIGEIAVNRGPDYTRPRLTTDTLDRVAYMFKTTVADLQGPMRNRQLVNARAVACKVFRDAGLSYPQIARAMHKACHSSIIHLCNTFDDRAARVPGMWEAFEALRT